MISPSSSFAPVERRQQSRCGKQTRKVVRLCLRRTAWGQRWVTRNIQETALGHRDEIIARQNFLRPGLAETGDRSHHDSGINRRKRFVTKALGLQLARLKTFQHDVCALYELSKNFAIRFFVEIEHLARLAGVEMGECGAEFRAVRQLNERRQAT